jgi:hypothetical protein
MLISIVWQNEGMYIIIPRPNNKRQVEIHTFKSPMPN